MGGGPRRWRRGGPTFGTWPEVAQRGAGGDVDIRRDATVEWGRGMAGAGEAADGGGEGQEGGEARGGEGEAGGGHGQVGRIRHAERGAGLVGGGTRQADVQLGQARGRVAACRAEAPCGSAPGATAGGGSTRGCEGPVAGGQPAGRAPAGRQGQKAGGVGEMGGRQPGNPQAVGGRVDVDRDTHTGPAKGGQADGDGGAGRQETGRAEGGRAA